jgi:hypothetical protein
MLSFIDLSATRRQRTFSRTPLWEPVTCGASNTSATGQFLLFGATANGHLATLADGTVDKTTGNILGDEMNTGKGAIPTMPDVVMVDMRIPKDRPIFAQAKSFGDLTDSELRLLARQQGFAGQTTVAAAVATWHHEIDFQPPDGGRHRPVGADRRLHMYERTRSMTLYRVVAIRRQRRRSFSSCEWRELMGDWTVCSSWWATTSPTCATVRRISHTPSRSIHSLLTTKATRAQVVAYLDCEFSTGRLRTGQRTMGD